MKKVINIWMQAIYGRLNLDSRKSLFVLLALFPVAGQMIAGLLFFSRPDKFEAMYFLIALLISLAALLAVLVISWFLVLAQNVSFLYSPVNARLVPNLSRILKIALCIPMLAIALISSWVMWLVVHKFSFFPAFISVLVLSFLVLIFRSPWVVVPFILSFQIPAILKRLGVTNVDKVFSENLGVPFEGALLFSSILILWMTLQWTFAMRDEALFALQERSLMLRDAFSGKKLSENNVSMGFATPFLMWMRTCIGRCIEQRKLDADDRDSTLHLSPFVLGPRLHWSASMLQMISIVVMCGLSLALVSLLFSKESKEMLLILPVIMGGLNLVILPFIYCGTLFSTLFRTQAEQGLMCLAPCSGAQDRRDKIMVNYLLRQFFILTICSILFALLIGYWVVQNDKNSEKTIAGIVLLLSCFFSMILVLTRQYARMTSIADHPLLKSFVVCALLFVMGLVMVFYMPLSLTFIFCALIFATTAALFVRYRSSQLSRAIFPVGRAA